MKQILDKKSRRIFGIAVISTVVIAHTWVYFNWDKNFVTILKDLKHDICCMKHFYFTQKYFAEIETIEKEGAMLSIKFTDIDTTYLLSPYIYKNNEKNELLEYIEEEMILYKAPNDSTLYFINKNKDTLKFVYSLTPSKGTGPLLIYRTKLDDMEKIPFGD